jgi:hypothetical protein
VDFIKISSKLELLNKQSNLEDLYRKCNCKWILSFAREAMIRVIDIPTDKAALAKVYVKTNARSGSG